MSKKIEPFDLHSLTNDNLFENQTEFGTSVRSIGADKLKIKPQFEKWEADYNVLDNSMKKVGASLLTKPMANCDLERDNTTIGMFDVTKANQRHFDPAVRQASDNLLVLFKSNKNITRLGINAQTGATHNMLQDLRGRFASDVEKVGIGKWVEHLGTLNDNMRLMATNRFNESAEKNTKNVKTARFALETDCKTICDIINVFAIIDAADPEQSAIYNKFIVLINTINAKYGLKRKGSSDNKPEEPTTPGGSEPAVDYPDAPEWLEDLPFQGVENGDIYYIMVDGKKVFYKLVDKQKFFWHPESEKAAGGWEKLS